MCVALIGGMDSIPIIMVHSCGVCSLRSCLQRFAASENGDAGRAGPVDSCQGKHCCRTAVEWAA
jgi:hypothetical protein